MNCSCGVKYSKPSFPKQGGCLLVLHFIAICSNFGQLITLNFVIFENSTLKGSSLQGKLYFRENRRNKEKDSYRIIIFAIFGIQWQILELTLVTTMPSRLSRNQTGLVM